MKKLLILILLVVLIFGCKRGLLTTPELPKPMMDGQISSPSNVDVTMPIVLPHPEIRYFEVTPQKIFRGEIAKLSWKISPNSINTRGKIDNGIGRVAPVGSMEISPSETSTYVLKAWGKGDEDNFVTTSCTLRVEIPKVKIRVCVMSGMLPNPYCELTERREFRKDKKPSEICNICEADPIIIEVEVCLISGLIPNPYCEEKEIRTFIKGEEPIDTCGMCEKLEAEVIFVGAPHWTSGGGKKNPWTKVAGNVENIGNLTATNIEVHIKLYWNDGTLAEERIVSIGDLAPKDNAHWSFKWETALEDLWDGKNKDFTLFEVTWL